MVPKAPKAPGAAAAKDGQGKAACFVCAKPCYSHLLIELLQIRLFADIRISTSNSHEPPPSRGPLDTDATYAKMGVAFARLPLHVALFRRLEIRFFVRDNAEKWSQRGWYLSPGLGAQRLLVHRRAQKNLIYFRPRGKIQYTFVSHIGARYASAENTSSKKESPDWSGVWD